MQGFEGSPLAKAQAKALVALRQEHGLTQAEAAKRIGAHYQQWQRYEQGKRQAPIAWIRMVEQKFRATLDIRAEPQAQPLALSPEQRQGVLIAARKLHALAQDLFELGMPEVTPLVPAAVRGIQDVVRAEARPQSTRRPRQG